MPSLDAQARLDAARRRLVAHQRRQQPEWVAMLGAPSQQPQPRQEVLSMSEETKVPAVQEATPAPAELGRNPFRSETVWTPEAKEAMRRAGLDVDKLVTPDVPVMVTVSLQDLVTEETRFPKGRGMTPELVYLEHQVDAEASDFEGYRGVLYARIITPDRGEVVLTHAYAREDGELLPVSEFITSQAKRGDVFQVVDIETRKGRTVYRPVPAGQFGA